MCTRLCLRQNLAIDWMQDMPMREDKMKAPWMGIPLKRVITEGGHMVNVTSGLSLRAVRGQCR